MSIATIVNSVRGILRYCKSIVNMGLRDARVLRVLALCKKAYIHQHMSKQSLLPFLHLISLLGWAVSEREAIRGWSECI